MAQSKLWVNLASNIGYFVLNIVVSLWLVSFLLRHLGIAAYGLVPLAVTMAGYFNVIAAGLNAAVGRHLTLSIGSGDHKRASQIFTSSLLTCALLGLLMCGLGMPMAETIDQWVNVPSGMGSDAGWLLFLSISGLAITALGTPFQSVIFSQNRFDIQNLGNILGLLFRAIVVLVLFSLSPPKLWHVGASITAAALTTFVVSVMASRRLTPFLRIRLHDLSWHTIKAIGGTGGWILINQIGTILLINIDLIVANKVMGAAASGQYSLILQWSMLLRNFATVIAGVFGPTILTLFAQNRLGELINYARLSVRHLGLTMAIPIGIVCGFSESILDVWLGPGFKSLWTVMVVATAHLALNLAYLPLHNVSLATNNVRFPGIVQIIAGALNLVLAIVMAKRWGLYGIAISGGLVLILRNLVFTPLYAARVLKQPWWTFVGEIPAILVMTTLVFAIAFLANSILIPQTWIALGSAMFCVGILGLALLWTTFLHRQEREALQAKVTAKFS